MNTSQAVARRRTFRAGIQGRNTIGWDARFDCGRSLAPGLGSS